MMNVLECSTRLSYSSGISNISDLWVTSQNITAGVAYQKNHLWVAAVSCKTFMRGPVFFFIFMRGSSAGDLALYSWGVTIWENNESHAIRKPWENWEFPNSLLKSLRNPSGIPPDPKWPNEIQVQSRARTEQYRIIVFLIGLHLF